MLEVVISYKKDKNFEEMVEVLESSKISVYDKSATYTNNKYHIIAQPENIYDEGETYLSHIIENYDKLSDYTIFIKDDIAVCVASKEHFKETTMNIINTNQSTYFYIPFHEHSDYNQLMITYGYTNVFDNYYNDIAKRRYVKSTDIRSKKIDKFAIKNACKELNIYMPKYYIASQFASFLLRKDTIHQRPKEFYIKVREWLIKNEIHAEVLRLLWPLFFIDECNLAYSSSMLELTHSTKEVV